MMENTLAFAIELFENTTRSRVHSIKKIEVGNANDVYFINLSYILRVKQPNATDAPFFSTIAELEILKRSSGVIAPELLAYDGKNGNMLSRYIRPGEMKEEKDAKFRLYRNLLNTSKLLHNIRILSSTIPDFDAKRRFNVYKAASGTSFDERYEKKVVFDALEAMDKYPTVLCHNDLRKGNFIYDAAADAVKLIDFEFAAMNSEIFDVASILSEDEIEPRLKERLILAYYGASNVTNELNEDIEKVIAFEDLLWYYWAMARYNETLSQTFLDLAKAKMARIRKRLRSNKGK